MWEKDHILSSFSCPELPFSAKAQALASLCDWFNALVFFHHYNGDKGPHPSRLGGDTMLLLSLLRRTSKQIPIAFVLVGVSWQRKFIIFFSVSQRILAIALVDCGRIKFFFLVDVICSFVVFFLILCRWWHLVPLRQSSTSSLHNHIGF